MAFSPKTLTVAELLACVNELRDRGSAIAVYDAEDIFGILQEDGNAATKAEVDSWYSKYDLEDIMVSAARDAIHEQFD